MRLGATKASATSSYNGLGNQLYDLGGARPSLDLDFAGNKTLQDNISTNNLIDFTRQSSGTYVGSDGLIKTATTNLLLRSEEFDNASWTKQTSVSVTANQTTSPDGATTADLITWTSATTNTGIYQSVSGLAASVACVRSVWIRADTAGGTVGLADPAFTSLETTVTLTTSWQRVQLVQNASSGGAAGLWVRKKADSPNTIYLWGAQLEQSSTVGEYVKTTTAINSAPRFDHNPTTGESLGLLVEENRTNLALTSEDFSGYVGGGTVSTNSATSPAGTSTADKLIATNGGTNGQCSQGVTIASGATVTGSVFVKAGGFDRLELVLLSNNNTTPYGRATVNPNTGAITSAASTANGGTNASASVVDYGNGWYRFAVTVTYPAVTAAGWRLNVTNSDLANGDGIKGVFLWGMQLEAGAFPTSYIPTTTAAVTRSADVASITGTNFGTTRTNLLLRSEEFNDATWIQLGLASVSANTTAAPSGAITADTITEDTALSEHRIGSSAIAWVGNTQYTFSVYVKTNGRTKFDLLLGTAGNWVNGDQARIGSFDLTAQTVSTPLSPGVASIQSVGNGWFRCRITATSVASPSASGVFLRMADSAGSASYTGNGSSGLYLWGVQLETGTSATAYIPTTTAAVSVFESSWYRQDEGTVYAEARTQQSSAGHILAGVSTGSFASSAYLSKESDNLLKAAPDAAPANLNIALQTVSTNVLLKSSLAFTAGTGSASAVMNGGTVGTDASTGIPTTVDRLAIGCAPWNIGTALWNGTIRRLTYWPQRLSNSTLQTITQ